jgi:hypothetical protein
MIMRKAALFGAAVCLAAPLSAQQATKKFDYKPVDGIQPISLAIDQVKVSQIVFKPGKAAGGPVRRSEAECVLRIDNDGPVAMQTAVAVALFDEAGNLVAAGSGGTRAGWVAAGEHDASAIRFPFVYRNMEKAKTFLVTLEVQPRPGKDAPASAPAN